MACHRLVDKPLSEPIPRYVPTKSGRNRRRIAPGRALTGIVGTDGQTDNLIPVYPPFNFVERGYNDAKFTGAYMHHSSSMSLA